MRYILLSVFAVLSYFVQAQPYYTHVKTEKYCIVQLQGILFTQEVTAYVDSGQVVQNYRDRRVKDENTGKGKRFNSEADVLNLLGKEGWQLVNAFPVIVNTVSYTQYVFKKPTNNEY